MKSPIISVVDVPQIPPLGNSVSYETYMLAYFEVPPVGGAPAALWVEFPADSSEDNQLHVHPVSDRDIIVAQGSGEFIFLDTYKVYGVPRRQIVRVPLVPGTRVQMPRGVLHTFLSGPDGLFVRSVHSPWVPLEDPKCLVYPPARHAQKWSL